MQRRFEKIQCVCTHLKMASRTVGRAYDAALEPVGLNSTQYAILVNVGRYQPVSQMRIADHLSLERTTLYRAVAILEKNGSLKCTGPNEGVAKNLELTPSGEALVKKARIQWEKVQSEFVRSFGKKKWSEFVMTLEELKTLFH